MITKHLLTFRWPVHRQVERFRSLNSVETKEASCFLFSESFSSLFFLSIWKLKGGWWGVCKERRGWSQPTLGVGRVLMADAGNMVCLLQCLHYCSSVCGRKEMTRLGFKPLHWRFANSLEKKTNTQSHQAQMKNYYFFLLSFSKLCLFFLFNLTDVIQSSFFLSFYINKGKFSI